MDSAQRPSERLRLDRAQGCLVGLAIGDALGATVEFLDPLQISEQFGVHKELVGEGWLRLQPGEVTDDTQLARILAESLLQRGGWDSNDFGQRLVDWLDNSPIDVGAADREAIERIAAGISPNESGVQGDLGSGNSPSARCAAAGIFYFHDLQRLRQTCLAQALCTHQHPDAMWGSVLVSSLIAWLIQGYNLQEARRLLLANYREASPALLRSIQQPIDLSRPSSYIGDTLHAVFYDLYHHNDFETSLIAVVNRGGDSDSAGAIAGAIAGAYYGLSQIPARWVEGVQWGDDLAKLGLQLMQKAQASHGPNAT